MSKHSTALHVRHASVNGKPSSPIDLCGKKLTDEQRTLIEQQALEVFTAQVNAGSSMQQALASVLLTGMDFGISSCKLLNKAV